MTDSTYIHTLTAPWGIGSYRYLNEDGKEDMGYGFFRPKNPNDFFPDHECCSEKEIEAHKEACRRWNDFNALAASGKDDK